MTLSDVFLTVGWVSLLCYLQSVQGIIVIPARYASTRLPGKPLAEIAGKPMIQWVYERARKAQSIREVWVATDDTRIVQAVERFGGKVMMTSPDLPSGTDRVAAVADQIQADYYVNVQGDEPLISVEAIDTCVRLIVSRGFAMSTVMTPFKTSEELTNPNVVKALVDRNERAIYFSRYPIPYSREKTPAQGPFACQRHVGLYGYRRETLFQLRSLPVSPLEKGESLEQLRALENGISIGIAQVEFESIGVDTPEDLERVRAILKSRA
jgi:3-deoxy-manno-octulosonate cytidylyltransferase (CMP-KDO synthetase)